MKESISSEIKDQVKEYAYKHYKMFKDKTLLITENKSCFFVTTHKDRSPLILSKAILNKI
jgi:hypothetical protein